MPAVICHRGLWYVNFVRVGGQFIRRFTPQQMQTHHFFCYLVSISFVGSLGRARCVYVCFGLFLPVRVGSKTYCSW
jgi:hypothetical protein